MVAILVVYGNATCMVSGLGTFAAFPSPPDSSRVLQCYVADLRSCSFLITNIAVSYVSPSVDIRIGRPFARPLIVAERLAGGATLNGQRSATHSQHLTAIRQFKEVPRCTSAGARLSFRVGFYPAILSRFYCSMHRQTTLNWGWG